MDDLFLLIKDHVEEPQKALKILADALEDNMERYSVENVVAALRAYQGKQQLIDFAHREGVRVYSELDSYVEYLKMQEPDFRDGKHSE